MFGRGAFRRPAVGPQELGAGPGGVKGKETSAKGGGPGGGKGKEKSAKGKGQGKEKAKGKGKAAYSPTPWAGGGGKAGGAKNGKGAKAVGGGKGKKGHGKEDKGKGGKEKGRKGGAGKGKGTSSVLQVMQTIEKSVKQISQSYNIIVAGMEVAANYFQEALEDPGDARFVIPALIWRTVRKNLCTGDIAVPGMDRVLAALDCLTHPDALLGVFPQGKGGDGKPLTLRISIRKNRTDVSGPVDALISQVVSPALWGFDSPYQIFIDGTPPPQAERGGLANDEGEQVILPRRIEWVLTTHAVGWTAERAAEWWKARTLVRRPDTLTAESDEEEDHSAKEGVGEEQETNGARRKEGDGGEGGGAGTATEGEGAGAGAMPTEAAAAAEDAEMHPAKEAITAAKREEKEEEEARVMMERTKRLAIAH